jgi:hypothetical protein
MKLKLFFLTPLLLLAVPLAAKALTYNEIVAGQTGNTRAGMVLGDSTTTDSSAVIDDSPDDVTPPAAPSNFVATGLDGQISLHWINPADLDFVRTIILRKAGATPSATTTDGTVVYEGTDTSFVDLGLANGQVYSYSAFSFDNVPNYSSAATAQATPTAGVKQAGTTATTTPIYVTPSGTAPGVKLVNDNGTFYLIQNGQKHGVTNPGMLASYGFSLSDARAASSDDQALPSGSLLTPADGALVKSQEDPTVYLISGQQRHGFTSPDVFGNLGFKFSSVLVVTGPELQALALASPLGDGSAAHLAGLDIDRDGTVYWIGYDNLLHAYPSTDVYNSWHVRNDFSTVVPANTSDNALLVGSEVIPRAIGN